MTICKHDAGTGLTVKALIEKYLRWGTRRGSANKLFKYWTLVAQIIMASEFKNARRQYPHPQNGFVREVSEEGVPNFLELWTELWQFGWLRSPFDARIDRADSMETQKEMGKQELAYLCAMRPFPVFSNSAVAAESNLVGF